MDGLMKLYKNERTNDYFKKIALMQIEVAHRIKEYLDADKYFPPKDICKSTMDLFLQRDVKNAISRIFGEVSFECDWLACKILRQECGLFTYDASLLLSDCPV